MKGLTTHLKVAEPLKATEKAKPPVKQWREPQIEERRRFYANTTLFSYWKPPAPLLQKDPHGACFQGSEQAAVTTLNKTVSHHEAEKTPAG